MSETLVTQRDHGYDKTGHQRLEQLQAIAVCDCAEEIDLWADTEVWVQNADGVRWDHSEYGLAQGVCEKCRLLWVDSFDGIRCFRLEAVNGNKE